MSLEKTLIEWCDINLRPGITWASGDPHNKLHGDQVAISASGRDADGTLKYQDSTGCLGFHCGYDVYQLPDGSYRVSSPDDHANKTVKCCDFDNIKEVLMYLAFNEYYTNISPTESCQLLFHKQIGMDSIKLFDHLQNVNDNNGSKEDILHKLDLDKNKCIEKGGYYVPDLTKCDDTDVKLIKSIRKIKATDYSKTNKTSTFTSTKSAFVSP